MPQHTWAVDGNRKPNIILVFIDDMGWADLSCFHNKDAKTPNVDRMATGAFGKWHMGGQRDVAEAPPITDYGFDESLTNFEGMGPNLLPLTMKPDWEKPGRIWADAERLGAPVTWMQRSTITSGFVDAALRFIKKAEVDNRYLQRSTLRRLCSN